jgi:hypothetical protein
MQVVPPDLKNRGKEAGLFLNICLLPATLSRFQDGRCFA